MRKMRRKQTLLFAGAVAFVLSAAFAVNTIFYVSAASGKKKAKPPTNSSRTATPEATPEATTTATTATTTCPHDAVEYQQKYGELGGFFVDLNEAPADAQSEPEKKKIYLTFDEGYENGYTEKILDTLKDKNVKAVFFITGDYAKRSGELVKRMIGEGQVVGNHTWRHYSMPEKSLETCREEIGLLHDYVKENFGYEMSVLRPPKGEFSEQTLALASEMGYTTCLWSFAYKDWNPDAPGDKAQSLSSLNDRLHSGGVYLLHAVSPTNAAILGDFIDNARAKGYEFVTP